MCNTCCSSDTEKTKEAVLTAGIDDNTKITAIDPWGEKIMGFDHNTLADDMSIFEHVSGKTGEMGSTYGDKFCPANY